MDYNLFLNKKSKTAPPVGFSASGITDDAFDFQRDIISWACKRGRAAIFAGTGLGKSIKELSWANELFEAEKNQF